MTRHTWCLVVLAVAAFAGCWAAGQAGQVQLSAGFGLVGGGFVFLASTKKAGPA